jgi:predicted nucleotide-binding protein
MRPSFPRTKTGACLKLKMTTSRPVFKVFNEAVMKSRSATTKSKPGKEEPPARTRLSQTDVPSMSLEKALRVAKAIADNYGNAANATPLQVAAAIEVQPSSGPFRMLTGASIAYDLTTGGYAAETISVTKLGLRIVRPAVEGDEDVSAAKREAVLRPRVIREFLQKYSGASIPKPEIAQSILIGMGVPKERAEDVFTLILDNATAVGFIREINSRKYVELTGVPNQGPVDVDDEPEEKPPNSLSTQNQPNQTPPAHAKPPSGENDERLKRVFITHGKNQKLIEPIKKLLDYGELHPVVAVQSQTVSQPVPTKVLAEMRSCGAAIIHVEEERTLADNDGKQYSVLNDNVLIEIGAAMALYGERFILIVKDGVKLPSNLQGLLELRYKGDTLDMEETVKLLDAIRDMKKRPLPA